MSSPKSIVKAGYDSIADLYLRQRKQGPEEKRLLRSFIARLPKGSNVLDAGCGAGVPVARILARDFRVVGVDLSSAQVQRGHRLVPHADFILGDVTALPLRDASLDGVCSFYAIIHIPREEHRSLMSAFHRVLRPGGLVLLCMGEYDSPEDRGDFFGAAMYWSHFDGGTNEKLVQESGFELLASRTVVDRTVPTEKHRFILARSR